MKRRGWTGLALVLVACAVFAYVVMRADWWSSALTALFPTLPQTTFPSASITELVVQHLQIVLLASGFTVAIGVPLGIWATRPSGADFRDLIAASVDFGQTFPPVAVLALMLPIFGFSIRSAITALVLYGLFPVVSNTVAGLEGVAPAVLDAARGMGMGRWRVLFEVELPLAARVIMAGIRTSVIITIGTATVAAVVAAGGLGGPIFAGIELQNYAFVLEGAAAAAMLAILADALLGQVEALLAPPG
jgi:osmoprotectant transport system permease protein